MDVSSLPNGSARSVSAPSGASAPIVERCRLDATVANEGRAQDLLASVLNRIDMPRKVGNDVRIALEELFVNVASYAYPSGEGLVEITVAGDPVARSITVTLIDWGVPFNPFSHAPVRTPAASRVEDMPLGGLGIVMVKGLMDECSYRRADGANEVSVTKRAKAADEPAAGGREGRGPGQTG